MLNDRRKFLALTGKASLGLLLAFNFGCSIGKKVAPNTAKKTALIYGTRYGSTHDTAVWINNGIGLDLDLLNVEDISFEQTLLDYDQFILGSGVWTGGIHARLKEFMEKNKEQLQDKVIASFVVCGSQDNTDSGKKSIQKYLAQFSQTLGYQPLFEKNFGGRIIVSLLSTEDKQALTSFYRKYLNRELENWNRMDETKAENYGKEINSMVTKP